MGGRTQDRPSSHFWEPKTAREGNRRKGDSSSQFLPLGLSCSCPRCTANPTLLACGVPSGRPSPPLCLPITPSHCFYIAFTCTRTHTAHSLVIAVPVQFNVLQIGSMCNDIFILLYQLRISRQLFLKQRKERKIRVGKRSQQLLDVKRQAFFPPHTLSQLRNSPQAFKSLLVPSSSSIFHNHLPG